MLSPCSLKQNHLLAALPSAELDRLAAHLELVPMPLGEVLYRPGGQMRHAYFPTSSIVSLQYGMESGTSAEIAGVGNEGVVGISFFMGGTAPNSAVVQAAGHAYRLEGRLLKKEFNRGGLVQSLMLRYTQALIANMVQTAACSRYHTVNQQFCRWLLLTIDRLRSQELVMTQASVASILGVRREGITQAAGILHHAGFIRCCRGHISVLERAGVESQVCECYPVVRKELETLLSDVQYREGAVAFAFADRGHQVLSLPIAIKPRGTVNPWLPGTPTTQSKAGVRPIRARTPAATRQKGIVLQEGRTFRSHAVR